LLYFYSAANLDADDPIDDSDANSDSDSDSDDDTAALMAELQKIKREKVFTYFTFVMFMFIECTKCKIVMFTYNLNSVIAYN